ncbi:capsid cement protein, partial [Bosea sp. CRIB-10]|uniref:capsid cement protein n=1 Tax=Bosea sp. CRIB-10 TaxID=378404 RepID=UPI001AECAAD5
GRAYPGRRGVNRNEFGPVKNFTAAGAIKPRRVVAFAATEGQVETAASPTAKTLIGVTGVIGAVAAGERVDVYFGDVQTVEAGAAFAQGARLTVDAEGRVIAAAPAATVTQQIIGTAFGVSTALGELVPVHIQPGALSNAANS